MGATRGPYLEDFPVGTVVEVAPREQLNDFARTWRGHHPLQPTQMAYAAVTTSVVRVFFYHGADELYELENVPGLWHEACLRTTN